MKIILTLIFALNGNVTEITVSSLDKCQEVAKLFETKQAGNTAHCTIK